MDFLVKGVNCERYFIDIYGSIENLVSEAKSGNINAQADLGLAYSEGVGELVGKDSEKAIGWLNSAVEKGYNCPSILGKLGELLDREGTPQYQRKAYELYHRAAKLGFPQSQLNLAEMYRCGVEGVVNRDIKEAFKWYKKVADEDTLDPDTSLGGIHYLVAGTVKKLGNALSDTKQQALKRLYKYYLEGDCPEGRPQPTKAVYYLNRAAELGDTEAQQQLGQIYFTGSCEQNKDFAKAKRWLEKASGNGDAIAKQVLQQLRNQSDESQDYVSDFNKETLNQSLEIMVDKLRQRAEANVHPFLISQPFAYTDEMLGQFHWSQTAKVYLQAYQLVNEGLQILHESKFTDGRGISFIARGYLTENSILQAFPQIRSFLLPNIFQLCEENLKKDPYFFEGLVLSFALHKFEGKQSLQNAKSETKKLMCIKNLIQFIQMKEPDSPPSPDPFKFDEKNYSSWLHVLYYILGSIYTINEATEMAAEAFENSLKCCPGNFESKRGLGYSLKTLYSSKKFPESKRSSQDVPSEFLRHEPKVQVRKISKFASWTTEKLRINSVRLLKEFLEEAPSCHKTYPNVYYYLASLALSENNMKDFKEYYELGQDAEENRLPFFDAVNLPLKDMMSPIYQLYANVRVLVECGNKACKEKIEERDLMFCPCRKQKYCSRACQKADWKKHKASCTSRKGAKVKSLT